MWETEPFEIQVSELENFPWIEDAAPILSFIRVWKQDNPRGTIQDYLDWLAVFDLQDEIREDDTRLKLISCHGAKGLQWKTVILIGCNEGIIPSKQSIESGEDIQICNERNLMYVACTRAEDHLILAVRPEEKTDDKGKVYKNPVSRFIGEMK
uniref:Putative helicase n=1 Tax=viral metagenome TaxID=1070528 RepID=A0A6M3IMP1_9ZZZZ